MRIGIILSTYNSPEWLNKVLLGYEAQEDDNFEILIADDGSTSETATLVNAFSTRGCLRLQHIWHEDHGFRKTVILNKAIMQTDCDYLIFSDGDCIPRRDFVASHRKHASTGFFLSGGYFKLSMSASKAIDDRAIKSNKAFEYHYLREIGQPRTHKALKLTAKGPLADLLNVITPTSASWNGMNSSGWREDILDANGFDERMQYGGEDRELGERLSNKGIKGKGIRYSAVCIHLDHERGYVTKEAWEKNRRIRLNTRKHKLTRTSNGIRQDDI